MDPFTFLMFVWERLQSASRAAAAAHAEGRNMTNEELQVFFAYDDAVRAKLVADIAKAKGEGR